MREKVGKSRNTVFFQSFVAAEGRKVGSLKRRVRSHLARRDEKLHAVVAPSTFGSQNVQSTSASELLEVAMSKKRTLRHISQNTPCSDQFWKLTGRKSAAVCSGSWSQVWHGTSLWQIPTPRCALQSWYSFTRQHVHTDTAMYDVLGHDDDCWW